MNATSGITVDWSHISVIPIKSSQHDSNTQACRGSLHWSVSLATDAYSGGGGGPIDWPMVIYCNNDWRAGCSDL